MNPMRETRRVRLIKKAQVEAQKQITTHVAHALQQRFKVLKRELRRANLRKTLAKSLRTTGDLTKAVDVSWSNWIDAFAQIIKTALSPLIDTLWETETEFWSSRDQLLDPIDPETVIANYEARVGRQISNIGDDTKREVLTAITDWYNNDEDFGTLINRLSPYFDETRAARIGYFESRAITNQVALETYQQLYVSHFDVVVAPDREEWSCNCQDMADQNPHRVGDEMPPYHPYCECLTMASDESSDELYFG